MYKEEGYLNPSYLLKALLTALFFIYYTDTLAYSSLGLYVSLAMTLAAIILAVFNFEKGLMFSLIIIFMSARVPRDLVSVMTDLKITKDVVFHSIAASTIASFSLAQWIMISLGAIAFLKLIKNGMSIKLDKRIIHLVVLYAFVMTIMYIATVIDVIVERDVFDFKAFLSDQRYFIISFCGLIAALYYTNREQDYIRKFVSILIFIGISSGLRSIGFIMNDIATGSIKLSFAGQAYLLSAVFFAFIYTYSKHYGVLKTILISFVIFAGAFNISRLDMLLIFFDGFILLFLVMYSNLPFLHKLRGFTVSAIILLLIVIITPIILFRINSSVYYFMLYKLEFFTKEIWSGEFTSSPAVRIYEFENIVRDFVDYVYPLFIGKGFGSYFTDWRVPFALPIGLFDYSKDQLVQGRYFRPHTFFNFFLLKGGLLMIWFYVYLIWLQVKTAKKLLWEKDKDIVMLASFTILFFPWAFNIFWRPPFIFLFSFLLIVLIQISNHQNSIEMEKI